MSKYSLNFDIEKNFDFPEHREFSVQARPSVKTRCDAIAHLSGIVLDLGEFPSFENYDDWWDVVDSRSGHAEDVITALATESEAVAHKLGCQPVAQSKCVIYLERAWVAPEHRGNGLALQLLCAARSNLRGPGMVASLMAYPDGENITAEDQLKLAAYYASKPELGLMPLCEALYPGIMIAAWE